MAVSIFRKKNRLRGRSRRRRRLIMAAFNEVATDALLLESGDFLLTEAGDKILLE
jgi:hypothetical protein